MKKQLTILLNTQLRNPALTVRDMLRDGGRGIPIQLFRLFPNTLDDTITRRLFLLKNKPLRGQDLKNWIKLHR